jgi:hypothetical protein
LSCKSDYYFQVFNKGSIISNICHNEIEVNQKFYLDNNANIFHNNLIHQKAFRECYSHCLIDIEHDGEMYLKVEGKTGWLSCNQLELFKNPVKNGEGCFVNNNFYSFGKVIYKTPLFIRILKASFIKFNSVTLK